MIIIRSFALIAASFVAAGLASADYINGVGYSVPSSTSGGAPTLGNTPGPGAIQLVTFTANGINFSGDVNYSLGGFLTSGGTASTINYFNGASGATNLNNTEWEFTGSAYFTSGQSFNVVHDDGVNMYINGMPVLLAGGPTAPVTSTFTYMGSTGTYNFDFIYVECCGGAADFKTTLIPTAPANPTPEPSTALLMATGCLSLTGLLWGRRRSPRANRRSFSGD